MIFIYCLRKGYLLVEWCPTSNFSQPIPPSLRVSHISVTWHLPATHSHLISSQIERREIGADWRDQSLVLEGQKRSEAKVEKDVNPICHVLTVLIRGLCSEQPLYPLIPSVYFVPHHPSQHSLPECPRHPPQPYHLHHWEAPLYVKLVQLKRWQHNEG